MSSTPKARDHSAPSAYHQARTPASSKGKSSATAGSNLNPKPSRFVPRSTSGRPQATLTCWLLRTNDHPTITMEMSAATANNYDAMASEIDTRRKAVSKAQSVAVELEKRREPNPIPTASSKLAKYRASSTALNSYNRSVSAI